VDRSSGLLGRFLAGITAPVFAYVEGGPGNVVALYLPRAELAESPRPVDLAGEPGFELTIHALAAPRGFAPVTLAIG
jgi:hypothetical protein